jgi:hypothetical protein
MKTAWKGFYTGIASWADAHPGGNILRGQNMTDRDTLIGQLLVTSSALSAAARLLEAYRDGRPPTAAFVCDVLIALRKMANRASDVAADAIDEGIEETHG